MSIDHSPTATEVSPADQAARLCFSKLRCISPLLKDWLRQEGVWEDLMQELHLAAWEAWKQGLSKEETFRLTGRRFRAFLKAYGYRSFRRNGHRSLVKDKPFSSIAEDPELLERALARGCPISEMARPDSVRWEDLFEGKDRVPRRADFVRDHPEEAILALLRETPGGMSKRDLCTRLVITRRELDRHCAPLIERGLVVEVKRIYTFGRPPTPLLVAAERGLQLPLTPVDRDERIRYAYFVEGKGIKRIAREFHHSRKTVRKAIQQTSS